MDDKEFLDKESSRETETVKKKKKKNGNSRVGNYNN